MKTGRYGPVELNTLAVRLLARQKISSVESKARRIGSRRMVDYKVCFSVLAMTGGFGSTG